MNSLLSSRIMLLHSPSGAGKTSLIQTSIVPAFEKRKFLVCATNDSDFTALRVNLPPPTDMPPSTNRYVFSVVNGLIGDFTDYERACQMNLAQAVEQFVRRHGSQQNQLLILDQLEEVLTLSPGDLEGQTAFFQQLGEVLDDSRRWALLAVREDYMGGLDRFRQYLPGQLRSTFRLDLLDKSAALRAVVEPARRSDVEFEDAAAHLLVNDLGLVHSGYGDEDTPTVKYPYIEPALLQVVCYSLFKRIRKDQGDNFKSITIKDVEGFRPFGKSIAKYYRAALREVANGNHDIERTLRDWVEEHLISKEHLRRQTRQKPSVSNPDEVLSAMQIRYLIRDDPRPGGPPSWELSHDMLVGPILEDNRAWRAKHLERWQALAEDWRASGHDAQYLLRDFDYFTAPSSPRRRAELTDNEQAFLKASDDAWDAEGRLTQLRAQLARRTAQMAWFSGLLIVSLLANLVLLVLLLK